MTDEPDKEIEEGASVEAAAPEPEAAAAPEPDAAAEPDADAAAEPDADAAADAGAEPVAEAESEDSDDPEADEPEAAADDDSEEDDDDEDAEAAATVPAPSAPARTRRRAQRDPSLPAPVVRASARYVRSSARKARLVCDQFRGRSVEDARAILAVTPRAIARDWSKLLESAVANAEHNHELVGEDLYVKAVQADEGPTIKRFQPRAKGRATRIRKRTSHLTILLTPKD
jgi:ribosomal protein L22